MRKYTKPSKILSTAADLFEAGEIGWTKGYYARTNEGEMVPYTSRNAKSFCSIGIIYRLHKHLDKDNITRSFLNKILDRSIIEWNDDKNRTKKQVIKVFRKAAKLAEQNGK